MKDPFNGIYVDSCLTRAGRRSLSFGMALEHTEFAVTRRLGPLPQNQNSMSSSMSETSSTTLQPGETSMGVGSVGAAASINVWVHQIHMGPK